MFSLMPLACKVFRFRERSMCNASMVYVRRRSQGRERAAGAECSGSTQGRDTIEEKATECPSVFFARETYDQICPFQKETTEYVEATGKPTNIVSYLTGTVSSLEPSTC